MPAIRLQPPLLRAADKISESLERHFWRCAVLFLAIFFACSITRDIQAKIWADELFTLYTARQAGPTEIVKAILEGCDGLPPLYAITVHAILRVVPHDALAVRLPATLGYCGMIICLLAFCRRRLPAVYSWVAVLLVCNATLYLATEGRSYGAVLGCAAAALLCWQAAAAGRRRILTIPLLALSLSVMVALHYYSIFFLAPLFLAELVRWRRSGKPDFAVLSAAGPALLVLAIHYPLIRAAKPFLAHSWAPATWSSIWTFYRAYCLYSLVLCIIPLGVIAVTKTADDGLARWKGPTVPEWVIAGALTVTPLCAVIISKYTTHVFVERYAVWALLGFGVLLAAILCGAGRASAAAGLSIALALLAMIAVHEAYWVIESPGLRAGEEVFRKLSLLENSAEPVVVPNHHVFLELSYYAKPPLRERLIDPVSRELDLRYLRYDTDALLISALSHHTSLRILSYEKFLPAHQRFILAATPKDYLPRHLLDEGYHVTPITRDVPPLLYEVEAPGIEPHIGTPEPFSGIPHPRL